jgi:chemotaxis protein methyltransferase CheR
VSTLSSSELETIELVLRKASGFSLSGKLRQALQFSFIKAVKASGLEKSQFLMQLAKGDADSISCLLEHSVIGETYFFRHPEQFAAVQSQIVSSFSKEVSLGVWSAGCATGEEPYSIAMMLADAGRSQSHDYILGTDISEKELRIARQAIYGQWSLRRLNPSILQRHFESEDDKVRVAKNIRDHVELRSHNLISDPIPLPSCHLIFCRNVLIYFRPNTVTQVIRRLVSALLPGGILVLGPVEMPMAALSQLEWVEVGGATILRKPHDKKVPSQSPSQAVLPPFRFFPPSKPALAMESTISYFQQAREAARQGRLEEAEFFASKSAKEEMLPESYLLLGIAAESRGDLDLAIKQVRRALYLEPGLATGHALLVALFQQLGKHREAEQSRRNALAVIEKLDESTILRGVETITAGALRSALEAASNYKPIEDD